MRNAALGFVLGLLVAAGICAWKATRMPSAIALPAAPSAELKGEKSSTLACRPVVVYRDRVSEKLGIPKAAGHVTASANIAASDHPHTATAVYNEGTGSTDLYIRTDPMPWLAFDRKREITLSYGAREGTVGAVARLGGRVDVVSIKALRIGLLADVDSSGGWFAGTGVRFAW